MKIFKNSKPEVQLYWFLLKKSLSFHNFKLFVPRKGNWVQILDETILYLLNIMSPVLTLKIVKYLCLFHI